MNFPNFQKQAFIVLLGTCGLISASASYKNPEVDVVMGEKAIQAIQEGAHKKIAHKSGNVTRFTEHYTFPQAIIDYNALCTSISVSENGHATVTLRGPVAKAPAVIQKKIIQLDRYDTIKACMRKIPLACLTDCITWGTNSDHWFQCTLNFEFETSKKSSRKTDKK